LTMKALVIALFAVAALATVDPEWEQFNKFMVDFSKTYESLEETQFRFGVFKQSLRNIERMNADHVKIGGERVFGVNGLADLTVDEFHVRLMKNQTTVIPPRTEEYVHDVPNAVVDWRTKGVVTPVKDQGQCGSCWAHSADEAQESFYAVKYGSSKLVALSQQQCTACTYNYNGCNGGWPQDAYVHAIEARGGLDTNANYPYNIAQAGNCKFGATGKADAPVTSDSGSGYVSVARGGLANALNVNGPVSVCVAAESWQYYTGGVLKTCTGSVDHCVQAVGYNGDASETYWTVRNSWGVSWGIQGYIYLDMTADNGDICHIQEYITYPTVQ